MNRAALVAGLLALGLSLGGGASAAPLAYSEAASGDLNFQSVGTLDAGENTIRGTMCFSNRPTLCPNDQIIDLDHFAFALPDSFRLDLITLDLSPTVDAISSAEFNLRLSHSDPLTEIVTTAVGFLAPASLSLFESALPLAAGDYTIWFPNGGWSGSTGGILMVDYTWTLAVSRIPAPATAGLLLMALAALGFTRRGRQRPGAAT